MKTPAQSLSCQPSKVRFHEEVRVRNIKAKGKKIPVSMMSLLDDDEEAEDPYGRIMAFDEEDRHRFGKGKTENEDVSRHEDEDEDDGKSLTSEEDDDENGSRDIIGRLNDDLFAEDETSQTGTQCRNSPLLF
jgi:U3 small nucleolar RNA-associated protein MPP10